MSVFLDAINVLEQRGWNQGGYESTDGRVCLVGALNIACGREVDEEQWDGPMQLLCRMAGTETIACGFNDMESTGYGDVVALLRRAHEATA